MDHNGGNIDLVQTPVTVSFVQILDHIGGIQEPDHATSHITCTDDDVMGKRIKFIIHRTRTTKSFHILTFQSQWEKGGIWSLFF
jgi:hypothetical protein